MKVVVLNTFRSGIGLISSTVETKGWVGVDPQTITISKGQTMLRIISESF